MVFFFFQGEDGIREAQETRGLGNVYKKQHPNGPTPPLQQGGGVSHKGGGVSPKVSTDQWAVLYTHLTLPQNREV